MRFAAIGANSLFKLRESLVNVQHGRKAEDEYRQQNYERLSSFDVVIFQWHNRLRPIHLESVVFEATIRDWSIRHVIIVQ